MLSRRWSDELETELRSSSAIIDTELLNADSKYY